MSTINTPLVSIVVPNYNYLRFLPERLKSIFDQTFTDYEVILLDDASTDGSQECLREYENHPKVSKVVINEVNTGSPCTQWDKGISLARGKYIWIAEADDLADPDFLKATVATLESDPDVNVVMTMSHFIGVNKNDIRLTVLNSIQNFEEDGETYIYEGNNYVSCNMLSGNSCYNASMVLFRRSAYEALTEKPHLSMRYCGDYQMWVNLISDAKVGVVHKRLNSFRLHGKSVSDEGVHNKKATAEANNIQIKILTDKRYYRKNTCRRWKYRITRDFLRRQKTPSERTSYLEEINEDRRKFLIVSKWEFRKLWLWDHFVRPLLPKEKPLEPIKVIRL